MLNLCWSVKRDYYFVMLRRRFAPNRTRIGSRTDRKKHIMPHDWKGREDVVAAGTSCPMPNCGALTIAYKIRQTTCSMTTPPSGSSLAPAVELSLPCRKTTWFFGLCPHSGSLLMLRRHSCRRHKEINDGYRG